MPDFIPHENAHGRPEGLDPKVNGPYLDEVRKEQEDAYRAARMKASKELETKAAKAKEEKSKPVAKKATPAKKTAKKVPAKKKASK